MEINCRKCLEFSDNTKELSKLINDYITSLTKEQRADQTNYDRRLKKCMDCDALINGLCKFCGCFVLVRAAKKNQFCPYPQNQKW